MRYEQMVNNLVIAYSGLRAQLRLSLISMDEANEVVQKLNNYSEENSLGIQYQDFRSESDYSEVDLDENLNDPYGEDHDSSWY